MSIYNAQPMGWYMLNPPNIPEDVDFRARLELGEKICVPYLFPKKQPLEIEIGCGKGRFALMRSQLHPEINMVAFDKLWKFLKRRKNRAEKEDVTNLIFFKAEAQLFLEKSVPDESVSIFHLYFPDPWPKRKHHGRRTFDLDFLKLTWKKTVPGGLFEIATDFEAYYEVMMKVIAAQKDWTLVRETVNDRIFEPTCLTNYELKYQVEGRKLHYLELKKVSVCEDEMDLKAIASRAAEPEVLHEVVLGNLKKTGKINLRG